MLAGSSGTSLTGRSTSSATLALLRCVPVSKRFMLSMLSPNRSSRTGSASPAAKMSRMPPRVAYSPGSITVPVRL